eukprot:CAMPEP_0174339892 /NCGR_PEP_ID=MMETSP0810-20121108/24259_1 /TAXON_ID=73025 ORGANISM="Eutreptiella gymnastica-like, Strain CCMP1594" /NCGR_SAMPLE_ID=MMETSP0810 /ASSEMBLY_ACC=CAM_ASM_000659 /LENGTH=192 /DNA_ID=CAMNT_0015460769 /DNA_START=24 /DNA_END=599 /DNA_ORIENTATION=-
MANFVDRFEDRLTEIALNDEFIRMMQGVLYVQARTRGALTRATIKRGQYRGISLRKLQDAQDHLFKGRLAGATTFYRTSVLNPSALNEERPQGGPAGAGPKTSVPNPSALNQNISDFASQFENRVTEIALNDNFIRMMEGVLYIQARTRGALTRASIKRGQYPGIPVRKLQAARDHLFKGNRARMTTCYKNS